MTDRNIDLLLLNGSNYPSQPIYPYGFVQVSALARGRGLTVKRHDFLGTPKSEWPEMIEHLVSTHRPRMIGFHIRQADSQLVDDYRHIAGGTEQDAYFPVIDSKALIGMVRRVSTAPVVVGGFGFALHGQRMFDFLQPDYGVAGAPDGFFERFDNFARRDLSSADQISNLVYFENGSLRFGPRAHFPPFPRGEYNEEMLNEIIAFYAQHGRRLSLGRIGEVDVPVEVMRGCPCQCYFCTEPFVKGKKVQHRNLDAIMEDVEFLAARDVRSVWFICSELNMSGMEFPLQLAERMRRLNSSRGNRRVLWKSYAMPRPGMSRDQIRYMMSAGYVPGWNEFASFDDANLKACRMPYRTSHVVRYFKDILELTHDRSVYHGPPLSKFEMFLGNAFMGDEAMRNTLAVVDQEGFGQAHEFGGAMSATRVYETNGRLNCGSAGGLLSISPDGAMPEPDTIYPTFHYSPELIRLLGTSEQVSRFLSFVGQTFLSCNYKLTLDVPGFVAATISAARLADHLSSCALLGLITSMQVAARRHEIGHTREWSSVAIAADALVEEIWKEPIETRVRALYDPSSTLYAVRSMAIKLLLDVLLKLNGASFDPIYDYLGIADEADRKTPYRIMRKLYAKFASNESIVASIRDEFALSDDSLQIFHLKFFMFANNVRVEPRYRSLLFESMTSA
jgi:hypothetical protein